MRNWRNNKSARRSTRAAIGSVLLLALAGCNSGSADKASSTSASSTATGATASESSSTASSSASSSADGSYDHVDLPGLTPKLDENLVNDSAVMTGTLDNGLRYFVQKNDDPGQSAELRLVINAGSVEEQGKTGIAHFVEHMLFNGTEKYPKNQLTDVMRSYGAEFGADTNAYTWLDQTVYELSVPTTPESFNTGLDVLNQWLSHATIDPVEVDAERGIVIDELRLRTEGPRGGVQHAALVEYLAGTAYADRDTIGTKADLETATAEDLRAYYEQWYRPSNASVIVVGDVDVDAVVTQITDLFGSTADPTTPEPDRPDTSTDDLFNADTKPAYSLVSDPDDLTTLVSLGLPLAALPAASVDRWQAVFYDHMIFSMLQRRLKSDVQAGTAPFDDVSESSASMTNNLDAPTLVAQADAERAGDTMQALLDEYERAARYGFNDNEFEVARQAAQAELDSFSEGANTTDDKTYADRIIEFAIYGTPYPALADEVRIRSAILAGATAEGLHHRFLARWTNTAPYLLIDSPSDKPETLPTAADLDAAVGGLKERPLEPRAEADTAAPVQLMERPQPVEPVNQQEVRATDPLPTDKANENFKPVEYTYPNGARVIINPSKLSEGQVSLSALSPGGTSVLETSQIPDALLSTDVVTGSGVGAVDTTTLSDIKSSSDLQLSANISTYTEGFDGTFASRDAETALAYLHLLMTAPQVDQTVLDTAISQHRPMGEVPQIAAIQALSDARYDDDPRHWFFAPADTLDSITAAGIETVWKDRFSNASDWVFVFSGDVNVDEFLQLTNSYLGTLPSTGADREVVNVTRPMPDGITTDTVTVGTGGEAQFLMLFEGAVLSVDARSRATQRVAQAVLSARITDVAREQFGETYSASAFGGLDHDPGLVASAIIGVTGPSESIPSLISLTVDQVADLGNNGPTADEFKQAVGETRDSYNHFDDATIASTLLTAAFYADEPLDSVVGEAKALDQVTAADVTAYIAANLPSGHYVVATVLPGAGSSSTDAGSSSTTG